MLVKLENGNLKDVEISDVTPENYIVPSNERHCYHCIIEIVQFDAKTGKRLSTPRIQKFGKKEFDTIVKKNLEEQGYSITILYNPTDYLATFKPQQQQVEKVDVEKAVAEALAKQKAETDILIAKAVEEALAKKAKQNKK